ncbi:hypothetical protein K491DRAFT_722485 [Lophiostoma macrostomum CBS 122681]|uniref:Uncharacterized protein n=1 Tax=Lophiostoma macrostomum CBS 122681 TaxID=1314788 RepID=A0A6A6SKZ9_9PLEO|nr:hypothetical protein K491DRAFT_722485 [Lophiostoma macrostomum CBS 122681]
MRRDREHRGSVIYARPGASITIETADKMKAILKLDRSNHEHEGQRGTKDHEVKCLEERNCCLVGELDAIKVVHTDEPKEAREYMRRAGKERDRAHEELEKIKGTLKGPGWLGNQAMLINMLAVD